MQNFTGKIIKFKWIPGGGKAVRIQCPERGIPAVGRYVLADDPTLPDVLFATPLFLMERMPDGFWAAPQAPEAWRLGASLAMRGPQGKGFQPPAFHRLALAVVDGSPSRLVPLLQDALRSGAAVALFMSGSIPEDLPAAVEAYPLDALPDAWGWADFLAMDIPAQRLPELRSILRLPEQGWLPCPAQALVAIPMPCGAIAECGVCAIQAGRKFLYLCADGPVVDLALLLKSAG